MKGMTYEKAISEIEKLLEDMENVNQEMDELIKNVKYISELIAFCKTKLHNVENELNEVFEN